MTNKIYIISALVIGVFLSELIIEPTQAAIKCKDSYQLIKGQWIGTPYCADKWLAQISGVSFKTLRSNPTERQRVSRIYGRDSKVASICGIDGSFGNRY